MKNLNLKELNNINGGKYIKISINEARGDLRREMERADREIARKIMWR